MKEEVKKGNEKKGNLIMKKWEHLESSTEDEAEFIREGKVVSKNESDQIVNNSNGTESKKQRLSPTQDLVSLLKSNFIPLGPPKGSNEQILSKTEESKSSTPILPQGSSKLNASAPEFIPLGVKTKLRRNFNPTFEAAEQEKIESTNSFIKQTKSNILPAWLRDKSIDPNKISLHEEIKYFVNYISPTREEILMRENVIKKISAIVKSLWHSAEIEVFGSFSTQLFLPYSDIDLVISGVKLFDLSALFKLRDEIHKQKATTNLQLIANAKVPIIKLTDSYCGCTVDISFNVPNGPENTKIIQKYLKKIPVLRPVILVLKYFLQQRALNETYSGGIGSYALVLMVISFLQFHSVNKKTYYNENDLGVLLTDFLEFYGTKFNYYKTGISVKKGGRYFAKDSREGWFDSQRPFMLALEDPHDSHNNVGKNSFAILSVKAAFAYAWNVLRADKIDSAPTKLCRILNIDETMERYRKYIEELYSVSEKKDFPDKENESKKENTPRSTKSNYSSPLISSTMKKENLL